MCPKCKKVGTQAFYVMQDGAKFHYCQTCGHGEVAEMPKAHPLKVLGEMVGADKLAGWVKKRLK